MMNESETAASIPSQKELAWTSYHYEIDGVGVEVGINEYLPKDTETSEETDPQKAVIFFPGWPVKGKAKSYRELNQSFADHSSAKTLVIDTKVEKVVPNSLLLEAKAVQKFTEDSGFKKITVGGYSEGGAKAINLAALLRDGPGIKVEGLILLSPVGVYEQSGAELAKRFIRDSLIDTPATAVKEIFKRPRSWRNALKAGSTGMDVVMAMLGEMQETGNPLLYLTKVKSELRDMVALNPRLEDINVPVVLIQGVKEIASDPRRVISTEEQDKIDQAIKERHQNYKQGAEEELDWSDPVGNVLRENLFPNSPYVRRVLAEKWGEHGVPLYRSDSVAKAALYIIERSKRKRGIEI